LWIAQGKKDHVWLWFKIHPIAGIMDAVHEYLVSIGKLGQTSIFVLIQNMRVRRLDMKAILAGG
jgi:hypothetical protein